jgi:L-histidine N-alpha-methyltransferase
MTRGHELGYPVLDDFAYHLTTLFPPVRPRRWLELRMIDALPEPWWRVAVAVTTAVLDDPEAAAAAGHATRASAGLWAEAAHFGLAHPTLARSGQQVFSAALEALPRLGADADTLATAGAFYERFVLRGRCPADDPPASSPLRPSPLPRSAPAMASTPTLTVDVHLGVDDLRDSLRHDAACGLVAAPKELPPKWFYDDRGSELFDQITRLPEYYPTRRERAILASRSAEIAARTGADTLVELGSGTSEKTRLLLDAMTSSGRLRRFVPFDVSEATLRAAADGVAQDYPGVEVHAVVGDFEAHLDRLPGGGRRLVAFLGGTIGNLVPGQRAAFLAELAAGLEPGDAVLLGTDLVKERARLEAAYDDAAGVTAEFNRNVLRVLNREVGADFDPERFVHVARWNAEQEWIEMWLRSTEDQTVTVADLGLSVGFAAGEEMRTEVSAKFRRPGVEAELAAAGLELAEWWTDPNGDYAVSLSFAG